MTKVRVLLDNLKYRPQRSTPLHLGETKMATEIFYTESGNSPPLAIVRELTDREYDQNQERFIYGLVSKKKLPAALRVVNVLATEVK